MRLNKYLASCGVCSRREADTLIAAGRVKINGMIAETGAAVHPESEEGADVVTLDGRPVKPQQKVMIALYKPVGVVSGTSRRDRAVPVTELVEGHGRLFPVGRLDKDSEGLMLLTNMGDLSERIAKAGDRHEKEYEVTAAKPVTDGFLNRFAKGVYITLEREKGGTGKAAVTENTVTYRYLTKPAKVKRLSDNSFSVILTEGKNRQIRRMCEELGNRVVKLKRIRIVNIGLGDLTPGKWRRLTDEEIKELEKQL